MTARSVILSWMARLLAIPFAIGGALVVQAGAETFSSPGFYAVTVDGWTRTAVQDGFSYRCLTCVDQIEIELLYGPRLDSQSAWRTTDEFLAAVDTKEKQRAFAESWMKPQPPQAQYRFEVEHVELAEIGGLKLLVIASKFKSGNAVIPEISMISVHQGRLMRLRLHTRTGALTDDGSKAVNAFLGGLKFEM